MKEKETHEHACCHNGACGHHDEHEHHHHSQEGVSGRLVSLGLTALLLVAAVIIVHSFTLPLWQQLLLFLPSYLLAGHHTLAEAYEGLAKGDVFNEHFLMSVATVGALGIGFLPGAEPEFTEAVFVMLFFQVGELFEGYAEGKSRASIAHLMNIRPDVAHVERTADSGQQTVDVRPEEVLTGETIIIRPGEKVPLDGVIVEGATSLNTVALTGETVPRDVLVGDEVVSGCINLSGVVRVRTTKSFGESTVSKIINLVEHATERKSKSEAFITRFARVYTPIVVFAALFLAVVPPLLSLAIYHLPFGETFPTWLYRALMFLVVSCPCALVISVPLTFFGGIGGASRRGILIKGASYIDVLARVGTVVFDKTGTLTRGQFAVTAVHDKSVECSVDSLEFAAAPQSTELANSQPSSLNSQLLHLAAHVEHYSTHPIGAALRDAFPDEATDGCHVSDVEELAGQGIRARVGSMVVSVGNTRLMDTVGAQWHDCPVCQQAATIIHVAIAPWGADGPGPSVYAGHIAISDKVKDDSAEAIARLNALGVEHTVMLTGDRPEAAAEVARQVGVKECFAGLLPADKVTRMEQLLASKPAGSYVAFVGDGINDAPVLARADVGIAMGGLGSDAAIEAADVVLMDDRPSKIATALQIARRTLSIARQNVLFAVGVKVAVLLLATVGWGTMWMAVFADVGVTVLAVLNAMRALKA